MLKWIRFNPSQQKLRTSSQTGTSTPPSETDKGQTNEAQRGTDPGHAQAAEQHIRAEEEPTETDQEPDDFVALDSRTQTNGERQSQKDKENHHTVQEPLQATETPRPIVTPKQTDPPQVLTPASTDHTHTPAKTDQEPQKPLASASPPQIINKHPAIVNVEDLGTNDIVIAVMGPTGSGKSTFIRSASGYDTQGVGHTLKSCTSEVLGIRFWDEESKQYVVLVDTPGFDDTYKSDLDILNMISDWLNSSYKKKKLLSAILYLHRITDNRMAGTPLKNLRVFRKLCGSDALAKVYLTTTMWDEVDREVGEMRLEQLKTEYWKAMITHGAKIACCRSDDKSPNEIIQRILAKKGTREVRLQKEMARLKMELKETSAGKQLYSQLETLVEKQSELLRRLDKERKAAAEPKVLADLQTEYNDLRAQIDDRLRQMEELKLPRLKSLRNLVSWRPDWWPS